MKEKILRYYALILTFYIRYSRIIKYYIQYKITGNIVYFYEVEHYYYMKRFSKFKYYDKKIKKNLDIY